MHAWPKVIHPKYLPTIAILADKKWAGFWKISLYLDQIKQNRNLDFNLEFSSRSVLRVLGIHNFGMAFDQPVLEAHSLSHCQSWMK